MDVDSVRLQIQFGGWDEPDSNSIHLEFHEPAGRVPHSEVEFDLTPNGHS